MSMMAFVIVILFLIVLIGVLNEKFFHLQSDIALLLLSLVFSVVLTCVSWLPGMEGWQAKLHQVGDFGFETYLLDFVLCFMLFAGASKVNMRKFKQNLAAISLLALLTTVISSAIYGCLFWLAGRLLGLGMDIWVCILLGCIVSPTDPIAATGILNKMGLSKNVTSVIENESLFNDGTGVALFVFVKSIITRDGNSNFLVVMAQEVLGALAVALVISFLLFKLLTLSRDPVKHLLISLLNVALVYTICELCGFSGVIASVVCGMYFAYKMDGIRRRRAVDDPKDLYGDFWDVADHILNSVLFVMIGLSVLNITLSEHFLILLPVAVVCVVLSRYAGVSTSALLVGKRHIPSSYSVGEFTLLMTWSALKGGLSLALAMGTAEFLPTDVYLIVLNIAYITIFFTVVVQGLTITPGYRLIEKHKAKRIRAESVRGNVL